MASYFLDTSALMKRYIAEPGYDWVAAICQPRAKNTIIIAESTLTEAVATFCRMVRENPPRLTISQRDRLITLFERHTQRNYVIVEASRAIFQQAATLCRTHPLRAYDAVQLACALTRQSDDVLMGNTPPIFVSADNILLSVATLVGFAVDNPNNHAKG